MTSAMKGAEPDLRFRPPCDQGGHGDREGRIFVDMLIEAIKIALP